MGEVFSARHFLLVIPDWQNDSCPASFFVIANDSSSACAVVSDLEGGFPYCYDHLLFLEL